MREKDGGGKERRKEDREKKSETEKRDELGPKRKAGLSREAAPKRLSSGLFRLSLPLIGQGRARAGQALSQPMNGIYYA